MSKKLAEAPNVDNPAEDPEVTASQEEGNQEVNQEEEPEEPADEDAGAPQDPVDPTPDAPDAPDADAPQETVENPTPAHVLAIVEGGLQGGMRELLPIASALYEGDTAKAVELAQGLRQTAAPYLQSILDAVILLGEQ